jgi:hypothetical protein
MKTTVILLLCLISGPAFTQSCDTVKTGNLSSAVTFETTIDIANATKDGMYMEGYVVNIEYEKAKELHGKKVKVSGKVTIIPGLDSQPKEYDEKGNEIISQGRMGDTKYIAEPVIEIIRE